MKRRIFFPVLAGAFLPAAQGADFGLRLDRLSGAFGLLNDADRQTVDSIMDLVKKGDHLAALQRLSQLNDRNPENSSLRVLTAYALLQAGNVIGALEQADKAHDAKNANSYTCWFYSKVALLNGKTELCKRELKHVKKAGDLPQEARQLEAQLKKKG